MIILDSINKTLVVNLLNAVTTKELIWNASWADITATGFLPGSLDGLTTGVTTLAMVPAPAASTQRQIKGLSIYNIDTVPATLLVSINNVTVIRTIIKVTLLADESLIFNGDDFKVHMSDGTIKTGVMIDRILSSPASGTLDVYPLLSPQVSGSNPPVADRGLSWNPVNKKLHTGQLAMTAFATTPVTPVTDETVMFTKKIANRNMPAFISPNGIDAAIQPLLARNKVGYWAPTGNSVTVSSFGFMTLLTIGTLTIRNVLTTNLLTRMRRLGFVSLAKAGSLVGAYQSAAQFTTGNGVAGNGALGGFFFVARIATADLVAVARARSFIGLSSALVAPTNVEPSTLTNSIGMAQISTDPTQWYLVCGGSVAQLPIPLGVILGSPANNATCYEISLFAPSFLNGVINYMVTNLATNVSVAGTINPTMPGVQTPASIIMLAIRAWRTNNLSLTAVGLDICSLYIETEN